MFTFLCLAPRGVQLTVVSLHRQDDASRQGARKHRHAIYATETSGLLFVALLLLVLILVRYWHAIHWSVR